MVVGACWLAEVQVTVAYTGVDSVIQNPLGGGGGLCHSAGLSAYCLGRTAKRYACWRSCR